MCVWRERRGEEGVYHNKIKMDRFNFFFYFSRFLFEGNMRNIITEELAVIIIKKLPFRKC